MPNISGLSLDLITGIYSIGGFLLSLWWIYIPLILFLFAKDLWLKYTRNKFSDSLEWILLELIPPREIQKTPKAMEQFFCGLHGVQHGFNLKDKYIDGILPDCFSLEIISQGGEIHFLIRTLAKHRDLVEANIYAQYPEAEISLVDDYVNKAPQDIPNEEYDLWGSELMLTKEDAYPIRTYVTFEKDVNVEEQRVDPIASLLEVLSKMQSGEQVWIQILIRPVDDVWKKQGEKLRDKLVGRQKEKSESILIQEIKGLGQAAKSVGEEMVTGKLSMSAGADSDKAKNETPFTWSKTKAEQEAIHALEQNISKLGYEVIIRYLYFAPKDIYRGSEVKNWVFGAYKLFNTQDLNGFKQNSKVKPGVDYRIQAKRTRDLYRKQRVLADYKKREFTQQSVAVKWLSPLLFERLPILNWFLIRSKPFVFNVEELATIYHFPIMGVKAPLVPKVEARKGEPPMGLPVK